jgi:hypothetical protein
MKTKFSTFALAALVLAAAGIAGCASEKKADAGGPGAVTVAATNTKCPYTGKPVNKSVTSTYKGQSIGFCCAGCQGRFDKASDADKAAMCSKATATK